jgi:hypothetical protein
MRQHAFRWVARLATFEMLCAVVISCAFAVRGDQVEMLNGDRYAGQVLSLGSETLVLQSEVLGTLKLPRARISTITLESRAPVHATNTGLAPLVLRSNNIARASAMASTNAPPDFAAALRQLGTNSNVMQQVQQQFLSGAGPEAQARFNDLMGGLLTGKIGVNELRAEAKSTLAQARSVRNELGDQGGSMLDSYLAILDSFLKETEPAITPTNTPPAATESKAQAPVEDK